MHHASVYPWCGCWMFPEACCCSCRQRLERSQGQNPSTAPPVHRQMQGHHGKALCGNQQHLHHSGRRTPRLLQTPATDTGLRTRSSPAGRRSVVAATHRAATSGTATGGQQMSRASRRPMSWLWTLAVFQWSAPCCQPWQAARCSGRVVVGPGRVASTREAWEAAVRSAAWAGHPAYHCCCMLRPRSCHGRMSPSEGRLPRGACMMRHPLRRSSSLSW